MIAPMTAPMTALRSIGLAAGLVFAASAAQAVGPKEEFAFEYRNYELATSEGRSVVLKRIDRAAERFCTPSGRVSLTAKKAALSCREATVADVVAEIDDPRLAALLDDRIRLASN
ncbi:MAG: UrcA family protein [Pseudomonadota bacterium]